jgi:multiple sugar transport system substrate-binding protein/putative aldouronate transport system substrate-binding protein
MLDGDTVQTLWVYGAEDVHWSTKAETFATNAGTDKEKVYKYEEGQFHLKQNLSDPNSLWKKNAIDPALLIAPLTNGFIDISDLANEGNVFFLANCKAAPESPASETYTENAGTIYDAKIAVITEVVTKGGNVDTAMQTLYADVVGSIVDQCLVELND